MYRVKLLGLGIATGLAVIGSSASAQSAATAWAPDQYLQINLGAGVAGDTHASLGVAGLGSASRDFSPNAGVFTSIVAGRSYHDGFALEVEGVYSNNNIATKNLNTLVGLPAKASVETYGGLINGVYNVSHVGPVVPYVGAGVGYGGVSYRVFGLSSSDNGAIWQIKTGVTYAISQTISLDLGYRYLDTPQFKLSGSVDTGSASYSGTIKAHTDLHVVSLGARVRF